MINLSDLDILNGKPIYDTNNDTYVVYEDEESIMSVSDYKLLGFLNGYSYSNSSGYLLKSTLYGAPVHQIYVDVDHATFIEGMTYAYFWKDRTVYKINERLEIEWEESFDDLIRQVIMDHNGTIFILFCNSRSIKKYNRDGKYLSYMNDSDDPTHYCRLYCGCISEGGGHLYVTGVDFFDEGKYIAYVDHYDARKCKRIERIIKNYYNFSSGVEIDDPRYTYTDMYVEGDYIYLYGRSYIEKYNIKMRLLWRFYPYSFDNIGAMNNLYMDSFHEVIFDNRKFKERIYFCTSIDTNKKRCSFGKLTTTGNLKWELRDDSETPLEDVEFNICVYNDNIYMTCKENVEGLKAYTLLLDNNSAVLKVQNGKIVKIIQNNIEELYGSDNYDGNYTIADKLKDGIEKIITVPLMHDNGTIMVDDDNKLLVDVDNPFWEDPDNYDYYQLIGDVPLDEMNELSVLTTRYGLYLMTKNGSLLKTLEVYEPPQEVEFIATADGEVIGTEEAGLIRGKTRGYIYFYILNDEYKFGQDIITKKKGLTLITKRKGHSILRKKRFVYKYIVKKLIDIDIIVEHLKQNNVLDTMLPFYVDKLRHHTTHMIEDMQKCLSPVRINLDYEKRYSYKYDGYDYPIRFSNTQIFMCNNIPYIRKNKSKSLFIEPMAKLVADEIVQPFLVFIDGKVVKWSDMIIVRDWQYSYIILVNTPEAYQTTIDAILFPCVVRYGEDDKILPNVPHMYFNEKRLLTEDINDIAIRIEITDKDVIGKTIVSLGYEMEDRNDPDTIHNTIIQVPTRDYDQQSSMNNLFVFSPDGRYFADSRFYMTEYGKNMYSYEFDEPNTIYKTFYFDKANDSKNMIYDIPNQNQVKHDLRKKYIPSTPIPEDSFKSPFDFRLSRDKSYLTNISEATRYIMGYNMGLLVDYYRNQSNIKSYTYDGQRVLYLASQSKHMGWLHMLRQRVNGLFDYVMIFVNDRLYDYVQEVKYIANEFAVPIYEHVQHGDKVEIIHFKNVDNNYFNLSINTDPDYINDKLRYDNFLLFGNSESGNLNYNDFDVESREQYPISFDYKNNFSEHGKYLNTSIKLNDFYYYQKRVNICSKRQFKSMYYKVMKEEQDEFNLDPSFRFCHYSNQYMIFVNGLKLTQEEWQLITPTHTKPRSEITIKLAEAIHKGDKINIFYIPDPYEEIILKNYSSMNGDIILDASMLDYSFDNELFLIFIDGRKILKDNIQNISSNRVRIKNTLPEWSTVCICKYLNPDRILQKVFSYGDLWTKSVDGLTNDDYEQLFIKSGVKK